MPAAVCGPFSWGVIQRRGGGGVELLDLAGGLWHVLVELELPSTDTETYV
jgi:hypothetical protein